MLLILAGTSIAMLAGENGIIKQAQDAKNETVIGEEKDKLNLAVQAAKISFDGIQQLTEANLATELTKNIGERDVDYRLEVLGEKFVVTYISTNHSYEVDVDGKIILNDDTTVAKKWYTEPGLDADGNKTLKVTNGEITLEIGDYIDYDPVTGARSINVDDINKITGYNPNNVGVYDINQTGSGTKYSEGELWEYGNEVTYYWDGTDKPYYTATNTLKGNLSSSHSTNGFNWYENGWKNSIKATISPTATDVSGMQK